MTRHAPHAYLLAVLYDAWNLATEPLRVRVARWDEERASALGDSETTFPVDWPHGNACPCEFCRSAAMGGG